MGVVDANVLVLNLDYQPLNVCNVRRAVVLLDKQKAVVIEQNGHIVTSERRSIVTPSVIRLAYHIKRPRPVLKMTRKEVLVRDDHTCQYCGKRGHDLTLDPPSTPSYLFSSYIRAGERKWFKFLGVEDSAAAS